MTDTDPRESRPRGLGSARAERTARLLTLGVFLATLLISVTLLAFTGYRTGFVPGREVYRTGVAEIHGCQANALQLGSSQLCAATITRWNDDVKPGLRLTSATEVVIRSRTVVTGTVGVASHKAFVNARTSTGQTYQKSQEVIMPADQIPLPGAVQVLLAVGCLVLAFVLTFVVLRLARSRLMRM